MPSTNEILARNAEQYEKTDKFSVEYGTRIIAAAIREDDGTVWSLPAPNRHGDVFRYIGETKGDKPTCTKEDGTNQGFISSTGKFVTRFQARAIAVRYGQLERTRFKELYSEDLW